ncbi:hypothetical protein AA0488_0702 [Kozakia baliensis NRIC 0488]|nr:hypothetical protein AA0488_0702 [Kozakia baliensis NRIC 0488]
MPGVLFLLFVSVAVYLRKNQIADNTAFVNYQRVETGKLMADLAQARSDLERAETEYDRQRDNARLWHGRAHDQRLARIDDRQAYRLYEKRVGIDPLILPAVPELPPFVEEVV